MRRPIAVLAAPAQQHYAEIGGSGGVSSGVGTGATATAPPSALVAPWTLSRLSALLADTQADFEVFTDVEATSSSLNLAADLGEPWAEAAGAGGGSGASDARAGDAPGEVLGAGAAEWRSSAQRLAGRYVRQLKFGGAMFSARLGAP